MTYKKARNIFRNNFPKAWRGIPVVSGAKHGNVTMPVFSSSLKNLFKKS